MELQCEWDVYRKLSSSGVWQSESFSIKVFFWIIHFCDFVILSDCWDNKEDPLTWYNVKMSYNINV